MKTRFALTTIERLCPTISWIGELKFIILYLQTSSCFIRKVANTFGLRKQGREEKIYLEANQMKQ